MITQQRSTIAPENLQEMLDSELSPGQAQFTGAQQYLTPRWFARQCADRLPGSPYTAFDPQCGSGDLLTTIDGCAHYGVDIDNRLDPGAVKLIAGNCVKVFDILDELFPGLRWDCANANPPFGKRWKLADGGSADSTEWTWKCVTKHADYGYFIANHDTIAQLGIDKHPWVYHYEQRPAGTIWSGLRDSLAIGIAHWKQPKYTPFSPPSSRIADLTFAWEKVKKVLDDERANRPPFNIYLAPDGSLRTYLSVRAEIKLKLSTAQITRLHRLNECHPLTLTTEKETRTLMRELVDCGTYTVQPEALAAINRAIAEVHALACPIMDITDFERVAYADEEETLECNVTSRFPYAFTKGAKYKLSTGSYRFTDKFTRNKVHFNEETQSTYTSVHDCTLAGQDRFISIEDDAGKVWRFMDRPTQGRPELSESLLWEIFQRPEVKTIADTNPQAVELNEAILRSCEMVAGYKYYPGQLKYLSRVAVKKAALIAAATGTGKTLMAISLIAMKCPERALIIAPQGTMRSSDSLDDDGEEAEEYSASQWVQELTRFAPHLNIYELFSPADYQRICSIHGGALPPGVYVTYYQAMFQNGARESAPDTWDDTKLGNYAKANFGLQLPPTELSEDDDVDKRRWCDTIGKEVNGIRCIIAPCLATEIGHNFDMVLMDEAHLCTNLSANVTQMLIRLQPEYRYALTATPIPNIVSNLFSLMGWLAVPDWYKGGIRNAAWPYSREELGRFNQTFLSVERDLTQEQINRANDPKWNGKCVKESPVISSPARLLKLLKPTIAYISKQACNANYIPPEIIDVRVPMGKEQSALYAWYLDRSHIPAKHPLVRARKQTAWLRNICADPAGFCHGDQYTPKVSSNLNPKVIAILELCRDMFAEGEQVTIINSRVGLSNTIQDRLVEAGVSIARIDSTIPAEQHAYQANLFKQGKARVMLMGIKCAAAHSFDQCNREIIGSLEFSPGPLNQADGRVDRVTNKVVKKIYRILCKASIDEVMYDIVAVKDDAATICLKGQRIPREFKPVDGSEVLALSIDRFDMSGATPERECELKWPKLCAAIRASLNR